MILKPAKGADLEVFGFRGLGAQLQIATLFLGVPCERNTMIHHSNCELGVEGSGL